MKQRVLVVAMAALAACDAFGPTDFDTYEGVVASDSHVVATGFDSGAEIRCSVDGSNRPVRTVPNLRYTKRAHRYLVRVQVSH